MTTCHNKLLLTILLFLFSYQYKAQITYCTMQSLDCDGNNGVFLSYQCPDTQIPLTGYNGGPAVGDAFVKYAAGNFLKTFNKVVILVEGIDFGCNHYSHKHGDLGYPNIVTGVTDERDGSVTTLQNAPILINELSIRGYDFVYLDF